MYKLHSLKDWLQHNNMNKYDVTWTEWYSIIAAVLMVGFLLILTTSTLNLVLQEMQDGRGRQWYLSAYAGAEWALELALLDMKNNWYGYDNDTFQDMEILWVGTKYPKISYEFYSRVESYSGKLSPLTIDIIPLFSIDSMWIKGIDDINFINPDENIIWNLITPSWGTSGIGGFNMLTQVSEKSLDKENNFIFNDFEKIKDILTWEDYLILQNLDESAISEYTLLWKGWWFTLPRAEVFSSAQVGKYQQNLRTVIDNTEFLWILRYSIYSWD